MNLYHTLSARTTRIIPENPLPADPFRTLFAFVICGIGLGTILCGKANLALPAWSAQGLMLTGAARSLWDAFGTVLLPCLVLLTGILISGFSACGQPLTALLLILRGAAAGAAAANVFQIMPLHDAFPLTAALILPYSILSAVILVSAAKRSAALSGKLTAYCFHGQSDPEITAYMRRFLAGFLLDAFLLMLAAGMQIFLLWLLNDRLLRAL